MKSDSSISTGAVKLNFLMLALSLASCFSEWVRGFPGQGLSWPGWRSTMAPDFADDGLKITAFAAIRSTKAESILRAPEPVIQSNRGAIADMT